MSVTSEQVESRVVETLASFGPDESQITRDATFEELDIDSLDLVELAQVVEDRHAALGIARPAPQPLANRDHEELRP